MIEVIVLLLLAVGVISIIAIANIRDLIEDIRNQLEEDEND